jgi:hypothetical protein
MRNIVLERFFDRIGEINDKFLEEVYLVDIAGAKATRRRRIAGGTAGIVVVTTMVMAYWRWRKNKLASSA